MVDYIVHVDVKIFQDDKDGLFYADCPSLELMDVGNTKEEARSNFEAMLDIFFDDIISRGTVKAALDELGWVTTTPAHTAPVLPPS